LIEKKYFFSEDAEQHPLFIFLIFAGLILRI